MFIAAEMHLDTHQCKFYTVIKNIDGFIFQQTQLLK